MLYLCTRDLGDGCLVLGDGGHVFQSKATSGNELKIENYEIGFSGNGHTQKNESVFLIFSLFTFHLSNSVASPLQIPCKSHSGMGD